MLENKSVSKKLQVMSFSVSCWPFLVMTIQLNPIEHLIVLNCCKRFPSLITRPSRGQLYYWVCLPATSELVQPRIKMGGGEGGWTVWTFHFPDPLFWVIVPCLYACIFCQKYCSICPNLLFFFLLFTTLWMSPFSQILSSSLLGAIPNLSLPPAPPPQLPIPEQAVSCKLLVSQPSLMMTSTMEKKN